MTRHPPPGPPSRRAFAIGLVVAATATACSSKSDESESGSAGAGATTVSPSTTVAGASTTASTTSQPAGDAEFISAGSSGRNEVALTFHTNGDVGLAHQLLDLLDQRRTHVTTFVVGSWLQQHPDWATRLVAGGHELANHTQTHPGFSKLTPSQMDKEITACRDVLRSTGGTGGLYFRPSGTANGTSTPPPAVLTAAAAAGYQTVLGYDVDPSDYQDPGANAVASRTIAALHPGAIVSLHFGHAGTIAALPLILDEMDKRHLTAVTASELLA